MGDDSVPGEGDSPDGSAVTGSNHIGEEGPKVIAVGGKGDIVLDVTFETSSATLRKSRKEALAAARKAGSAAAAPAPDLKPKVKVAYRVSQEALKKHSNYFFNLLSNPHFREAKLIADAHDRIKGRGSRPAEADVRDLPWITIADDDEATKAAGREQVFEDMLRVIHQEAPKVTRVTMSYLATLAITADRFDCTTVVSHSLNKELKSKWPVTSNRPMRDDAGRATDVEQVLRQKILVSWLLGQPLRLHNATRELIIRGSSRWGTFYDAGDSDTTTAAWWSLPDGLEHELQYRRDCILNAIASVQRHFLHLYSSRERQCKLGYDSSAACDSFQLGQLLRFLMSKDLLFLVDFSPSSLESVPDTTSTVDIHELLATLRQCPSYQVDKHHANCGPRIRVEPVLDFIRAMLSANVVAVSLADWKRRREDVSWEAAVRAAEERDEEEGRTFEFTRALSNDQRLRMEGAIWADRMAKKFFTSASWDWTPEA